VSHDFYATIHGDREALFRSVFDTNRVPIETPIGEYALLPGLTGKQMIFKLALKEITADQRAKLVAVLAQRFGYPESEVEGELDAHGVPILARDASVVVYNPMKWTG
jgi:hypothetical protein